MKERPILFNGAMVRALLADRKTQTRRIVKPQPDFAVAGTIGERGVCARFTPDDERLGRLGESIACPYAQPGDRLWVKETFFAYGRWETRFSAKNGRDEWHFIDITMECANDYLYAADGGGNTQSFIKRRGDVTPMYWKRPAIFMPKTASRITLEVVSVRVERLQDISEDDALAEGITCENVIVSTYYANGHHEVREDRCFFDGCDDEGFGSAVDAYAALWESINGVGSWEANPWLWVVEFRRLP